MKLSCRAEGVLHLKGYICDSIQSSRISMLILIESSNEQLPQPTFIEISILHNIHVVSQMLFFFVFSTWRLVFQKWR